jgi:quercetin dioxygenase-like cupin family protein
MSNILTKLNKLSFLVEQLEVVIFDKLVSWESVQNWNVGESKEISGSINLLVYREENIFIFETIIPPGVTFSSHWHDFYEHNFVISGTYTDEAGSRKIGQWVKYDPEKIHEVSNLSRDKELKLIVIFTRHENK